MIAEITWLMGLYVLGVTYAGLTKRRVPFVFTCLSGLLWGLAIWTLTGLAMLSIGVTYSAETMFSVLGGLFVVGIGVNLKCNTFTKGNLLQFAGSFAALLATCIIFTAINLSVFTYDSFAMVELAQSLTRHGQFHADVTGRLGSWGCLLPLLQSAAPMLKLGYLRALQPAMTGSFLTTFCYLAYRGYKVLDVPQPWTCIVPAIATVTFASVYFVTFQAFYIHNSMPSAVFLSLSIGTMWLALTEKNNSWLFFSVASIIAFSLLRTESPAFAALFLLLLLATDALNYRTLLAVILSFSAVLSLWYLKLYAVIPEGGDLLNPDRSLKILAGVASVGALAVTMRFALVRRLVRHLPLLMLYGLSAVVLIFSIRDPQHAATSTTALVMNSFVNGRWGIAWIAWLFLLGLAALQPRLRYSSLMSIGAILFILLVDAAGFMRTPYRFGFGDSANRMLTHITPILTFYILMKFAPALAQPQTAPQQGMRARCIVAIALLALGCGTFVMTRPVDVALDADVIESPACSPGHEFDVALRSVADNSYVASAAPGPSTVVLDLGSLKQAKFLELVQYHANEALEDYGWYVSQDNVTWTMVYDTQHPTARRHQELSNVTSRYDLSDIGSFRYVKLIHRSAKGQDRLLLRKVSIYARHYDDPFANVEK